MGSFKDLWDLQLSFNDKFFMKKLGKTTKDLTFEEKATWSKNQILSIIKEATEVLDEIPNWKEHRNIPNAEFVISNLIEEIIDVNKFSVGLAQIWGMDMEAYIEEYMRKSYVVEQRWAQEQELKIIDKDSKIVGLDIDGVLAMYPFWFVKFCQTQCGLPYDSINEIKNNLNPARYEEIKGLYRMSGWKATIPTIPDASKFTKKLKEMGYTIILITARPYRRYSRIYPDTLKFLSNNDIKFDAIIWDKNKHIKIINEFPNMKFMVEDNPHNALSTAVAGYKVFLMQSEEFPINESAVQHPNIRLIKDLNEIFKYDH